MSIGGVANPLRILLIEDEPANRELVRAIFDTSGDKLLSTAVIQQAASIDEARAKLAGGAFDVVLLDLWLPDGDGLSLAREIRAMDDGRPVIIAVSGSVQPAEQTAALTVADEFLLKPFERALLVATVGRLARRQ